MPSKFLSKINAPLGFAEPYVWAGSILHARRFRNFENAILTISACMRACVHYGVGLKVIKE